MAEHIKREDALGRLKPPQDDDERNAVLISDARKIIREFILSIPAEDVVEVVRCKDCRSFMKHPTEEDEMCCGEWPFLPIVNPNDFCSDGKKRKK